MNWFTDRSDKIRGRTKNEVNAALNPYPPARSNEPTTDTLKHQVFDLTNESPESSPTKNSLGRRYQKSTVKQLLEEDDKEHHKEHVVLKSAHVRQTTEHSEVFANPSTPQHGTFGTTAATRNASTRRKRGQSSPEERRALGSLEPEPEDRVRIAIPSHGVSQDQMSPHKKFKPFNPIDTLNDSRGGTEPRSGKTRLLLERDGRTNQIQGNKRQREDAASTKSQNPRENSHSYPSKKPRVETTIPKVSMSRSVISIDSNDEAGVPVDLTIQPFADMMIIDPDSTRFEKHADSVERSQHTEQDERHRNSSAFVKSPSLRKILNLDQEVTAYQTRSAGNSQRESKVQPNPTQSQILEELNQMIPSSPSIEIDTSARMLRLEHSLRNSRLHGNQPKRPLVVGNSPDPLQNNIDSPISKKKARHPMQDLGVSDSAEIKPNSKWCRPNHTHRSTGNQEDFQCFIESIVAHGWDTNSRYILRLSAQSKTFSIQFHEPLLETERSMSQLAQMPVEKIRKIEHAPDDNLLLLRLAGEFIEGNKLCLKFTNDIDLSKFVQWLREQSHFIIQNRTLEHMTRAFDKLRRQNADQNSQKPGNYHARPTANPVEKTTIHQPESRPMHQGRRHRLIDFLDDPHSNSPDQLTIIKPSYRKQATEEGVPTTRTSAPTSRLTRATTRTTSPYFDSTSQRLRDDSKETPSTTADKHQAESHKSRRDVSDIITAKSRKPLKLHGPGKRSESISWEDLERLNDDQFLNDNLISFFLLYLQKRVEPAQLRRMHFFNTFFFSALTKDVKGRSDINYKAVARWTKNVNLFSRDFVIVPVNENLHWFVMIICNLPYLKNGSKDVEVIEDLLGEDTLIGPDKVPLKSDIEPEVQTPEKTSESFRELSLEDNAIPKSGVSTPSAARKGRKFLRGRRAQKYDVDKPVIITLDSLDQPRSSTASALRRYIVELASDANQSGVPFEVDASSIKGMTAKGIPHQNNFSDCGLYLCMYMEQFMRDPDAFVRKILQRDEYGERWPEAVISRDLRERLAKLVDKLYQEQEETQTNDDLPAVGSILVDMLPPKQEVEAISPPENSTKIPSLTTIKSSREMWEARRQRSNTRHLYNVPTPPTLVSGESDELLRGLKEAASKLVDSSNIQSDHDCPRETFESSYQREQQSMQNMQSASASEIIRSPLRERQRDALSVHREKLGNDIPLASATELRSPRYNRAPYRSRSNSVSTDFLSGDRSYVKESIAKSEKLRTVDMTIVTPLHSSPTRNRRSRGKLYPETIHPSVEIAETDEDDEGIHALQNSGDEHPMLV